MCPDYGGHRFWVVRDSQDDAYLQINELHLYACVLPPPPVARITVTPTNAEVPYGGTITLTAHAYDANDVLIPEASVTWSTSNAAAVTVASSGALTATATGAGVGSATITATAPSGVIGSTVVLDDPGTRLVVDSFTDYDGTALSAHTPEINPLHQAWTLAGSPAITILGGRATVVAGTDALASIDAGVSDGSISTVWWCG